MTLAVAAYVDAFLLTTNAMAALAQFVFPLFGYAFWCLVIAISALLGWRARDDWLRG